MQKKLEELHIEPESAGLQRIPNETVKLSDDDSRKVLKVIDMFEDDDDVQKVFHNLEISDKVMSEM
jgi:transcriptional/translational regulatory protein YebC/TACO1